MNTILFEIGIILLLVVANGVFAMAEIALVSAKRAHLRKLAENGNIGAKAALLLSESPNRFLATVQIGITLVGIIAGAYGGSTLAKHIEPYFASLGPWVAPYSSEISFGLVVLVITYLSLVIGELVPKRLGMANPEAISIFLAKPMNAISSFANPVVTFLSTSTDGFLRLIGVTLKEEVKVSEDEIKTLMNEGLRAGVFFQRESEMVESVLALDRLTVKDIMTPRSKIIWIKSDDTHEMIWHRIVVSAHTTFPVYDKTRDNVLGFLNVKGLYANLAAGVPVEVVNLVTPAMIVPSSQSALRLLDNFKKSKKHIALTADEFGSIIGLVTLHDIMEAILGEFPSPEEKSRPQAIQRDDGSWLVDAILDIEDFIKLIPHLELKINDPTEYRTVGGFVLKHFDHIPKEGESIQLKDFTLEIIDMDQNRIDKILLFPRK